MGPKESVFISAGHTTGEQGLEVDVIRVANENLTCFQRISWFKTLLGCLQKFEAIEIKSVFK